MDWLWELFCATPRKPDQDREILTDRGPHPHQGNYDTRGLHSDRTHVGKEKHGAHYAGRDGLGQGNGHNRHQEAESGPTTSQSVSSSSPSSSTAHRTDKRGIVSSSVLAGKGDSVANSRAEARAAHRERRGEDGGSARREPDSSRLANDARSYTASTSTQSSSSKTATPSSKAGSSSKPAPLSPSPGSNAGASGTKASSSVKASSSPSAPPRKTSATQALIESFNQKEKEAAADASEAISSRGIAKPRRSVPAFELPLKASDPFRTAGPADSAKSTGKSSTYEPRRKAHSDVRVSSTPKQWPGKEVNMGGLSGRVRASSAPQCPACQKCVYAAEMAKDGKDVPYHKLCFRCTSCSKSLVGLEHRWHGSKLYCDPPSGHSCYKRLKATFVTDAVQSTPRTQKTVAAGGEDTVNDLLNSVGRDLERTVGGMVPRCTVCGSTFGASEEMVQSGMSRTHKSCFGKPPSTAACDMNVAQAIGLVPDVLALRTHWGGRTLTYIMVTDHENPSKESPTRIEYTYLPDPKAREAPDRKVDMSAMGGGTKVEGMGDWKDFKSKSGTVTGTTMEHRLEQRLNGLSWVLEPTLVVNEGKATLSCPEATLVVSKMGVEVEEAPQERIVRASGPAQRKQRTAPSGRKKLEDSDED